MKSMNLPTWTDKEVLVAIGSVIGTLLGIAVPVVLFLLRRERANAISRSKKVGEENQKLRQENLQLQQKLNATTVDDMSRTKSVEEMRLKLEKAQQEVEQILINKAKIEDEAASLGQQAMRLKGDLDSSKSDLGAAMRRIDKILRKDGQTWTERVLSGAPEFKQLQPGSRRTPIISVLNLKGGVGKTTITANLGAALDHLGYRVLLIDLDLQGSLTSLFLSEFDQEEVHKAERLIGDFLAGSFGAEHPNLLDYAQAIQPAAKSGLVATSDDLAYAEMNLTIRWLLRDEGNRDPRFLLRRELQLKRIISKYDFVLLDCPPLINVSCVNALAASDYVLIPILPSKQATARVPMLLRRLKAFKEKINSDLNVLGIIANRTHRSDLTVEEENRLSALRGDCKDIWGMEVPLFDTFIRQNVEVRAAEDGHRPLTEGDQMFETFLELAREVQSRLPTFCRPALDSHAMAKETAS
jgi:cellulose biosynthesis protein BcsQ